VLSFIDHTRERLSHHSKRQARGGDHARADRRPDHGVRDLYRKYACQYPRGAGVRREKQALAIRQNKRQHHSENRFDIAFLAFALDFFEMSLPKLGIRVKIRAESHNKEVCRMQTAEKR